MGIPSRGLYAYVNNYFENKFLEMENLSSKRHKMGNLYLK
jgi:hypothetical protein